jgi:isopentenyl diphosphate isomerase/L-lactate dehydrogenase-like FMN-dependent dehydrogenase
MTDHADLGDLRDSEPINVFDYERLAEQRLPRHVFELIAAGYGDELTVRRNRTMLDQVTLRPRYLRDVSERDLSTSMLGSPISMPVFISPAGAQRSTHPGGAVATVQGAATAGTLTIVPASEDALEEVARTASGPLWLQFYMQDRAWLEELVRRAEALGYRALCVTVDMPVVNIRERDRRNRFLPPFDRVRSPREVSRAVAAAETVSPRRPFTWADLEWLRETTSLPLVLKGLVTAEDARLAVGCGVDGILVSNHGGRVFDGARSSIESLPEIVDAAAGRAEIYFDSGIRRGTDVVKALALGARAVGIGRPFFWGLAVAGADGVAHLLEILRRETELALAFCGHTHVRELPPDLVHVPRDWHDRSLADDTSDQKAHSNPTEVTW